MPDPTTTMPPDAAHALALITQGLDLLAATDLTRCPDTDLITVAKTTEQTLSRLTYHGDRQWMELSVRGIPRKHGHTSMHAFAGNELHASDITRRMRQVRNTQTPPTITGEPVTPECPTLAAAFAAGDVGPSHITVVLDFVKALPVALPHDVKVAAEQTITELATQYPVDQVKDLAAELMARLDPDGSLIDKPDRHRRRGLWLGKQGIDGMSKLTGTIDPVLRAHLETLFAAWGQPGVNNPDDESSPAGDARATEVIAPAATAAAQTRDTRSQAQRNHDAVTAMLKAVFADGMLGTTNRGLPIQVIVKTDVADLAAETGHAITATGTLLPIPDLIDLLPESQMYLSVFKNHTAVPLYFGQAKRIATPGQRLALFSAPDGHHCAAAGCDRQAAYMEIHHAVTDYARGGRTDIIELAPLCPTHHRMVGDQPGQFSTGKIESGPDEGRTWWQHNAEPGAPPTERLVNRLPDVAHNYFANLEQVRAEIHGRTPLERAGFTLNRINVFDVITPGLFTADTPHAHAFRAAMKSAGL